MNSVHIGIACAEDRFTWLFPIATTAETPVPHGPDCGSPRNFTAMASSAYIRHSCAIVLSSEEF